MATKKTSGTAAGRLNAEQKELARQMKELVQAVFAASGISGLEAAWAKVAAEMPALFNAPGGVAAANQTGILGALAGANVGSGGGECLDGPLQAMASVVRAGLAAGLDPNVPSQGEFAKEGTPLARLVQRAIGTREYDALCDELLAAGADPNLILNGDSVYSTIAFVTGEGSTKRRIHDRLLPRMNDASRAAYLFRSMTLYSMAITREQYTEMARAIEDKGVRFPALQGLTPFPGATLLHYAVLFSNKHVPFRVEALLEAGYDPSATLPGTTSVAPPLTAIRGVTAGIGTTFRTLAGATPLDLALGARAATRRLHRRYGERAGQFYEDYALTLDTIAATLEKAGARSSLGERAVREALSGAEPLPEKSPKPAVDALLLEFAARCGVRDEVAARLASMEALGGPWDYFEQAVMSLRGILPLDRLDTSASKVGWLLGKDPAGAQDGVDYDRLSVYPPQARKDLQRGVPIFTAGADVIFLLPWKKGGECQVMHAHPEGYWLLGNTVLELLTAEIGKIVLVSGD